MLDERFDKIIILIEEIQKDVDIPQHLRNNLNYTKRDLMQVYSNYRIHKEKIHNVI